MLPFVEHEFVEFFGQHVPLDEDSVSYAYTAERDGMQLRFTIWPVAGDVYADVFRDGVSEPVGSSRLHGCTHARFSTWGAVRCLEIGRPAIPTSEPSVALSWGLRLAIDPHIRVGLIS